jgi:hypothetical protein
MKTTFGVTQPSTTAFKASPELDGLLRPGQSIELLKELHILTREGKLNQDSRRKLKQIFHLFQFIEPLLTDLDSVSEGPWMVDHGAGKSYLGFMAGTWQVSKPGLSWSLALSNWLRVWAFPGCLF